jgi:hypothetical protein
MQLLNFYGPGTSIFVMLPFCLFILCINQTWSLLLQNDYVLVIGDRQVFDGFSQPFGFLNLIQSKVSALNVSFEFLSEGNLAVQSVNEYMKRADKSPNVSMIIYGTEQTFRSQHTTAIMEFQILIEMMRKLESREIIVISPFLIGERYDGENFADYALEEFSGTINRIALVYNATFIEVRGKLIKYLERNNIENLDNSVLTYDGFHLNEKGHSLVATQILLALGIR